jgi:hypothetical protein
MPAVSVEVVHAAVAVPEEEEKVADGVPPLQAMVVPLSAKVTEPVIGTVFAALTGFVTFGEIAAVRVTAWSTAEDVVEGETVVVVGAVVTVKLELVAGSDSVASTGLRETVADKLKPEAAVP